jgi:uncharacterized protein (TIGR03083 family)
VTEPIRHADEPAKHADEPGGAKERIVSLLRQEWLVIADLLARFRPEEWSRPALPGWDVHDVVAHMIGTERALAGGDLPQVPEPGEAGEHVRNDVGRVNEAWIIALRDRSHADLLADFRAVTAERLAALEAMSPAEFEAPSWTPAGNATYGRFMQIRVFDCWMHEQDIRAATGMPGHESGPVAEEALAEVIRAVGYIVGKRAGAPDGSSVRIRLTGPITRDLNVVVAGRARLVDAIDGEPTASLQLPSSLFLRLAGGREPAEAALTRIELGGDELGRRVATNLAYTI